VTQGTRRMSRRAHRGVAGGHGGTCTVDQSIRTSANAHVAMASPPHWPGGCLTRQAAAVRELHDEGLFEEFGVSNFSAWQVAEASEIAARHGWIRPSVYQGLYNAITRAVEPELFKCLGNYGIRFHAYNPLAGGAFSRSFGASGAAAAGSRFDGSTVQGKLYRDRYWNDAYRDALAEIHRSCEGHGLDAISVALRWLIHHSQLSAERNDGIIIGASSLEHLRHNLNAVTEGPLPTEVLAAIDGAALKAQPKWPRYFSGV
jgi:aflatoxin B1 aldehyde reductase